MSKNTQSLRETERCKRASYQYRNIAMNILWFDFLFAIDWYLDFEFPDLRCKPNNSN